MFTPLHLKLIITHVFGYEFFLPFFPLKLKIRIHKKNNGAEKRKSKTENFKLTN